MADMDVKAISRERLKSKKPERQASATTVKGAGTDFAATEREKLGTLAGKGLGKSETGAGMPKQEAGEDAGAYGERLRKWREGRKGVTMDHAGSALANKR